MRFVVKKEIFEELPSACFGVVMAKGIDNNNACSLTTSTKPDRISHVPYSNTKTTDSRHNSVMIDA